MNVLQLIDSLNPGGAERVAVNIANALVGRIDNSHLCVTRKEGSLKAALDDRVQYHYLGKKRSLDMQALYQLKRIVKQNKIDVIHAHSTSFFIAAQLKMILPSIRILWHEHYGARIHSKRKRNRILRQAARRFDHIVTVNSELQAWWQNEMGISHVHYIPNFVVFSELEIPIQSRPRHLVCLANLREPKDHLNLLQAISLLKHSFNDWKLLLIGKDLKDDYSKKVHEYLRKENLESKVDVLGQRDDTHEILQNAAIGVLSSSSEGLPMALLEYGMAGLAVVTTDVGNCPEVITTFGQVVPRSDSVSLSLAIKTYVENKSQRVRDAELFREHVCQNYSDDKLIERFIELYRN